MRGQYSLEVLLVLAGFFVAMSIFVGIYMRFSEEGMHMGSRARMKMELGGIRNAVNDVYVLGPGNEVVLEVGLEGCVLSAHGREIVMRAGGSNVSDSVFVAPEVSGCGKRLRVRNDGGIVKVGPE